MSKAKLVILRGPSGSGKSTVAKRLQELTKRPLAVIEQDYYKMSLFSHHYAKIVSGVRRDLLKLDAQYILAAGYDVVIEGITSRAKYGNTLRQLIEQHDGSSYVYYFDIPFSETLKRHASRPKSAEFGPQVMKDWYIPADQIGAENEVIITAGMGEDEIVKLIKQQVGI